LWKSAAAAAILAHQATMASERTVFRWRPSEAEEDPCPEATLDERLAPLVGDRAASGRELVLEASELMAQWLRSHGAAWQGAGARNLFDRELEAFVRAHGWRGTVARWLGALRGAFELVSGRGAVPVGEVLLEELASGLGGECDGENAPDRRGGTLAPGRRLPDRAAGARAMARTLARGEVFLVHGWSESVAVALETLFGLGLRPIVILSEGGADLGGRRLARRLSSIGIEVTLSYDLAVFEHLTAVDRLWVGCEEIGAGEFLARRGTRALFEEARRLEVECAVVATSDKLTPGGILELPRWPLEERWILWEDAPPRVVLDSQTHERVPSQLADAFLTETGSESAASLALRALPTP
jgi:hypothetical protein